MKLLSGAKPARVLRCVLAGLVLTSSLIPQTTPASGVVVNCTDEDLRATLAGGGTVLFACDGTIVLTNTLTIATNTVLDASGHQIILSGGGAVRPFVVNGGVQFTLKNVTVADGLGANSGGAMVNNGLTRLIDCTFSNNTVISSFAGVPAFGGAVFHSAGSLDISACAFLFNRVADTNFDGGFGFGSGGAIANSSFGTTPTGPLNVTNCTFLGNSAWTWGAIAMPARPGAHGPANLVNSTFVGNSNGAVSYVQGLTSVTNRMVAMNCIFANNNGPNCSGVIDGGYNISSDSSGGFTHPFSLQNVDPRLGPLADNGGPTLTLAPLPDSPAIEGGGTTFIPTTDQRGVSRPFGAASDVGAFEFTATATSFGSFYAFATTNFVSEAGGSVAFTVIRAGGTTGEATVEFATGNGTATAGSDFTPASGVLVFNAGQQSNTVHVTVLEDNVVEGNESFNVTLANPTGGTSLGRTTASVTISDNDSAFQFSSANFSATEEMGSNVVTVVRAGSTLGSASVNFATAPGTAISEGDYFPTNGVLNFASGQTSATFTVRFINDVAPEPTKTVMLQLSSPTGGAGLGTPATATLSIIDTDPVQPGALQFSVAVQSVSEANGEAVLAVVRAGGTNGVVSAVFSTSGGTAADGLDFTPTNGLVVFGDTETRKLIRVAITPDAVSEGPESFNVTLSNPSGGATIGFPATALVTIRDGTSTLTSCDEASLRAAVNAGGKVALACDGTIILTTPLLVSVGVSIEASGHNVTISGNNATRLFMIQPGVTLSLRKLTLADGWVIGTAGGTSQPGGPGEGGAVYNDSGTLLVADCGFLRNKAVGGVGGPASGSGSSVGAGGTGAGGAIFSVEGDNILTDVGFIENRAIGGNGGGTNQILGVGDNQSGAAFGGAVHLSGGSLSVHNGSFTRNGAAFGLPGRGFRVGRTTGVAGGAVYNAGGNVTITGSSFTGNACGQGLSPQPFGLGGTASGGAIYHQGHRLELTDTLFLENRVMGGATFQISSISFPGDTGQGGALFLNGMAAITNCTLAGNLAQGGPRGMSVGAQAGSGLGGAIYNQSALDVLNTTLAGNAARGGGEGATGGSGLGGGLCNSNGVVTLRHVTLADNLALRSTNTTFGDAFSLGGGLFSTNGSVKLLSTIIANSPSGSNGFGSFLDGGHNISSDASFNFSAPGSLNNTDPALGPLTDYGGPTPTMALLDGSPAIDSADAAFCPATDQRGIPRPFGAGCDIGAFESGVYPLHGQVHGFTTPASGIQLAWPSGSISVPPGGQFTVPGLAAGTYLLSISSPECVFVPRTLSVTVGPGAAAASFFSYRSNALVIERLSASAVRIVFAGEDGATYRVLSGTSLPVLTPYSTNQAQSNGLLEFTEGTANSPTRFFQVVRP